MSKGCSHHETTYARDFLIIVVALLLFLVLREGLSWLFKTNHVYSTTQQNQVRLDDILQRLERNGVR